MRRRTTLCINSIVVTSCRRTRQGLTAVLQQQSLEFLASIDEALHRAALDLETEVQRQALEMDAVVGQHVDVRVVDEADAVQVDDAQVRRVRLDLPDVDHLVDLFLLLVAKLERSCGRKNINRL